MHSRILVASVLAAFGSGCLTAQGTAERPLVRSLEIRGVNAVSQSDIQERLATQPSSQFLFFRKELYEYDADALANDTKRIVRYYQSQGYYRARVTGVEVRPAGPGRVDITIQVDEGEPVLVQEVRVVGLETAAELKVPALRIRPGQVFTEARFDTGRDRLLELLRNSGYARAEVEPHAEIDSARTSAQVTYTVKLGERYRFGNAFVAGSVEVPRARIREEAQSAVQPGAVFDESQLPTAQRRVFDLGVFGGVRVSRGVPDPSTQTIPVVVAVREAPFHTIRVGPGAAYEASRLDVRLMGGWADRNWLGGLRKLNLDGRIGYALLIQPNERVDGFVGALTADFTQPGAIARPVDLHIRLGVERGLEPAYSFWVERARVGFPMKLGSAWSLVPSYNLELYQISPFVKDTGPAATSGQPTPSQLFLAGCPLNHCVLSYFEQQIAWDGRDDPIQTHSGVYLGVALQEGFRLAGSGFRYLRLIPEVRGFVPLSRRIVLAARLRLGFLMPLGGDASPIVARFNSGGPNSMRGYYTSRLSPVLENTSLPIGGEGMAEGSLELRFPLSRVIEAAVFLDAGHVGVKSRDALDLGQLQYALGFGLRYLTAVGPLRVDVAANLPKFEGGRWIRTGTPIVRTDLSPTGVTHHEPIIGFHLSIGEAF